MNISFEFSDEGYSDLLFISSKEDAVRTVFQIKLLSSHLYVTLCSSNQIFRKWHVWFKILLG